MFRKVTPGTTSRLTVVDFKTFLRKDKERMGYWKSCVERNEALGDEFLEAIESGRIREIIKPL